MLDEAFRILNDGVAAGLHPGAQLYVSLRGRVVADVAVGEARPGVAMTPGTRTLWMSAGKPVTAVAALQLVDAGRLALDAPVADVIPAFAQGGKGALTLRQLLNHTAGFRGPLNNFTPGRAQEIVARACALKLEPGWVPGERAGYHIGSSWFVLGELVRRVDGRSIDAFARERIFEPLGEPTASIGLDEATFDARGDEVALMFVTERSPPTSDWPGNTRDANTTPRPGANARGPIRALGRMYESLLRSSAGLAPSPGTPGEGRGEGAEMRMPNVECRVPSEDVLQAPPIAHLPSGRPSGTHSFDTRHSAFGIVHASPPGTGERGPDLLSPSLARAMTARQRVGLVDQTFKQVIDWGLGVMIDSKRYAGEHQYGFGPHASPEAFGHSGNQSSCAFADPRHGLVVAWTCNGMPGEARHQARAGAINAAVYEDLGL